MHSRTFATPSADGGVGVRAMIPVIDMFNHAGDEAVAGLLSGESAARDNCRWGPVSPGGTDAGEWVMQVCNALCMLHCSARCACFTACFTAARVVHALLQRAGFRGFVRLLAFRSALRMTLSKPRAQAPA